MDFVQAFILSVVEGVSEFLPISSTGHLVLASKLLNIPQNEFTKTFEIAIQLGAILAVVFLYWRRLLRERVWVRVVVAFVPTALIGFGLYKVIKQYFIGNLDLTLITLLLGGVIIILAEKHFQKREGKADVKDLSLQQAAYIGVIQAISVIPGVSRAGATILGGMFIGLSREAAVEMSFLLAVPTMIAATGYDLLKSAGNFDQSQAQILILGILMSFLVALGVIKWFLGFVRKSSLIPFGIYRIVIALIFLLFLR